jgi:hypothetical protein
MLALYAVVFVFGFQVVNARTFHIAPAAVFTHFGNGESASPDLQSLERYPALTSPYGTGGSSKPLQQWLCSHRKTAPEYYLGGMGIYTPAQLSDRLRDLSRFRYAVADGSMLEKSREAGVCTHVGGYQ